MKYQFESTSDGKRFTYDLTEVAIIAEAFKGKRCVHTVEPYTRKRTLKQNKSTFGIPYRMIADALTEQWGEIVTVDTVHQIMKERFEHILFEHSIEPYEPKEITAKDGHKEYISPNLSTTKLSTIGMNLYYEALQQFGSMFLNISIPSPNENKNEVNSETD